MTTYSSRLVHNDEKRHKCSICGSVRYESYLKKITSFDNTRVLKTRYGHETWACRNKNCQEKAKTFMPY
jgi:formate dehydrogenase maturation protein FdhE